VRVCEILGSLALHCRVNYLCTSTSPASRRQTQKHTTTGASASVVGSDSILSRTLWIDHMWCLGSTDTWQYIFFRNRRLGRANATERCGRANHLMPDSTLIQLVECAGIMLRWWPGCWRSRRDSAVTPGGCSPPTAGCLWGWPPPASRWRGPSSCSGVGGGRWMVCSHSAGMSLLSRHATPPDVCSPSPRLSIQKNGPLAYALVEELDTKVHAFDRIIAFRDH
jgi:hypothetical protein